MRNAQTPQSQTRPNRNTKETHRISNKSQLRTIHLILHVHSVLSTNADHNSTLQQSKQAESNEPVQLFNAKLQPVCSSA